MATRRNLGLGVVVGLILATLLSGTSAHAAHARKIFFCDGSGSLRVSQSISVNIGDTLTVYNNCTNSAYVNAGGFVAGDPAIFTISTGTLNASSDRAGSIAGLGSVTIPWVQNGTGALFGFTVNVVSEPLPPPPVFVAHDYLQAVGLPPTGSCDDVDPEAGHWPGAPHGGWSQSWEQWMNDGRGGAVCVRTVETTESGVLVLVG